MRCSRRSGIALLTAIWVLTVLLVLASGFAVMVHSGTGVARNFGSLTQARWAAQAGLRRAEAELLLLADAPYTAPGGLSLTFYSEEQDVFLGPASYQVLAEDEASKINLNTASAEVLAAFFPVEVVDAIVDWKDPDSSPGPQGAEDEYYTGLPLPYYCKNALFDTVGELALVRGVTRELLSTVVTDNGRTLENLLTVWSWDRDTDAEGQPRVDLTRASRETLTAEFGEVLTPDEIDAIISQRSAAPFASPADLLRVPNLPREKVVQIYDRLTTSQGETRAGLINVNTAPWEVLAALPGMDAAIAQALVAYRETEQPFGQVGEILLVEQVTPAAFMRAADLLTVRSSVFRIVSSGQLEDGVTHTISSILQTEPDGDQMITRVLYWRE